jgi:hypothetical protein
MAKKNIAANADTLAVNDLKPEDGAIKFISKIPDFHFILPVLDDAGKQVIKYDANGGKPLPEIKEYHFTKVYAQKGSDGKPDPSTAYCFFIASQSTHGKDFQRIVDNLNKHKTNPRFQLFTEDDYFANRNPEAFRIAKEKSELEDAIAQKNARIEELEKRLGFKKQG